MLAVFTASVGLAEAVYQPNRRLPSTGESPMKSPMSSEEVRFIREDDDEGENEVAQPMKVQLETDEEGNAVKLGSGNDGSVYLVSSVTGNKKYALKVFNESKFGSAAKRAKRRERELEVTRKLGEACREEGVAWIAIPYASLTLESGIKLRWTESKGLLHFEPVTSENETATTQDVTSVRYPPLLTEYLGKGYTLGKEAERQKLMLKGKEAMVQHLQQFAADVLEAVTFMHKHWVTHHDLYGNMFVDGDLRVRVIDFGFATERAMVDDAEVYEATVVDDWSQAWNSLEKEASEMQRTQKDGNLGPEFKDATSFMYDLWKATSSSGVENPFDVYEKMVEHPFVKEVFESRWKKEIWVQIVNLEPKAELNGKLGKLKKVLSNGEGTVKVFGYKGLYVLKEANIQKVERQVGIHITGKQKTGELRGYHSGEQRYEVMTEGKVELYPLGDLRLSPMKDN